MLILGIETSCDETAAAVVRDGKEVLSNAVYSQVEIHAPFCGVVPEIASRNHLKKVLSVIESALSGLGLDEIDAVAVSNGPGLVGSLLVGLSTAKSIAYSRNIPLIPVNHILGHLYAPHLDHDIEFPYIGLVVSGGHSILYRVESYTDYEMMGSTIDDAVGEAFDKVAKLLGLGYPGGPVIDRTAKNGDPGYMDLPQGLKNNEKDRYNFSYSGLKTAVAFRLKHMGIETPIDPATAPESVKRIVPDVCASFQKAAVDALYHKTLNAVTDTGIKRVTLSGGVAANSYLREKFSELEKRGVSVYRAGLEYCGDNAAMIAGRAYADYQSGREGDMSTEAYSRIAMIRKGKR